MEDASDFGMDNAKACHAVVLTTMEQDRCSWEDTNQLDRFRRSHAQRPVPVEPNLTSSSGQGARAKKSMPCKYFLAGYCDEHKSHLSKGVWYTHAESYNKKVHKSKN